MIASSHAPDCRTPWGDLQGSDVQPVPVDWRVASLWQGDVREVGRCHCHSHPALAGDVLLLVLDPLNGRNFPFQQSFREVWLLMGLDPGTATGRDANGEDLSVVAVSLERLGHREGRTRVCRTWGRAGTRRGPLAWGKRCVSAFPVPPGWGGAFVQLLRYQL